MGENGTRQSLDDNQGAAPVRLQKAGRNSANSLVIAASSCFTFPSAEDLQEDLHEERHTEGWPFRAGGTSDGGFNRWITKSRKTLIEY